MEPPHRVFRGTLLLEGKYLPEKRHALIQLSYPERKLEDVQYPAN
jgi:hypothetical protein